MPRVRTSLGVGWAGEEAWRKSSQSRQCRRWSPGIRRSQEASWEEYSRCEKQLGRFRGPKQHPWPAGAQADAWRGRSGSARPGGRCQSVWARLSACLRQKLTGFSGQRGQPRGRYEGATESEEPESQARGAQGPRAALEIQAAGTQGGTSQNEPSPLPCHQRLHPPKSRSLEKAPDWLSLSCAHPLA